MAWNIFLVYLAYSEEAVQHSRLPLCESWINTSTDKQTGLKFSNNNVILSVNNFKFYFTWTDIFTFISKVYSGNSPYT